MSPTQRQQVLAEQIDLSAVLKQLQTKEKFSEQHAEKAVSGYRRFLHMAQSNPTEIMVPNDDVDTAWHLHILDTEAYMRDCQALFGQYLHHNPHFYGTDAFFVACEKTQEIYTKTYGSEDVFLNISTVSETSEKPAYCSGMLKDEANLAQKPAYCSGMLKDETNLAQKPAYCSGMLKDEAELAHKPAYCSGMLKDEANLSQKPSYCSGMLKDEAELAQQPAYCSGMLKDDVSSAASREAAAALFQPYNENSAVH